MSTSPRPRIRVALSATPPLLADGLRALLADEHTEVILVLDGRPDSRGGGTLLERGADPVRFADLPAVRRYVRQLATSGTGVGGGHEGEPGDQAGATTVGGVDHEVAAELP